MWYLWIDNNRIDGGAELYQPDVFTSGRFQIEVTEEIYNSWLEDSARYIYQDNSIVANPEYEEILAQRTRTARIEEIKAQLNELDLKSIRALRSNEEDYLQQYEEEAIALRNELRTLIE